LFERVSFSTAGLEQLRPFYDRLPPVRAAAETPHTHTRAARMHIPSCLFRRRVLRFARAA
jgi:hypothetical protein